MLMSIEQQIEQVVLKCWVTLSGYEEITAKCISDMLLCACTGNKFNGIVVTGKLVLNVEVLFNALDYVILMCKSSHELLHKSLVLLLIRMTWSPQVQKKSIFKC